MARDTSTKSALKSDRKAASRHPGSGKAAAGKTPRPDRHPRSTVPTPEGIRGHAEELALQADLAAMGVRDELRAQVEAAEGAWLAARGRLEAAVGDADAALASLKGALRKVLADLSGALDAADSAVRRHR